MSSFRLVCVVGNNYLYLELCFLFIKVVPCSLNNIYSGKSRGHGAREGGCNYSNYNSITSWRQHNIPWWHNMVCGTGRGSTVWFAECIGLGLWIGDGGLQAHPSRWPVFRAQYTSIPCFICFQYLLSTKWKFRYCLQFWRNCYLD